MTRRIVFSYLISILLLICSCKKCVECKAFDRTDNSVSDRESFCGDQAYLDEMKTDYINLWNKQSTFAECENQ